MHCHSLSNGGQGRRRSRKPFALRCWLSITQQRTNTENAKKYKGLRYVQNVAQIAQKELIHNRHTSI